MAQSPYRFLGKNLEVAAQVRRIRRQIGTVIERCDADVAATLVTQSLLVVTEAKRFAPIDPDSDTPGALKDSVRLEERPNGSKFAVRILVGGPKTKKPVKKGKAGYEYEYDYARAVEFGTVKTKAHPFFFPIYRARKKDIRAAVKKAIRKAVRENFP